VSLRDRIGLQEMSRQWLNMAATKYHYMHRPIHQKAAPFGWAVTFDGKLYQSDGNPSGFIIFASVHFTKLKGQFGYDGLPTKWQVLMLARLWLHDNLPRNSETVVIGKCLRQSGHERMSLVQRRWLEVHPPRFPNEPYHILKILSDCNIDRFRGEVYRAANFRELPGVIISKKRHKNTRGPGQNGERMIRFVYDLTPPRWEFHPLYGLPLYQLLEVSQ
jgi:hypothetical protein